MSAPLPCQIPTNPTHMLGARQANLGNDALEHGLPTQTHLAIPGPLGHPRLDPSHDHGAALCDARTLMMKTIMLVTMRPEQELQELLALRLQVIGAHTPRQEITRDEATLDPHLAADLPPHRRLGVAHRVAVIQCLQAPSLALLGGRTLWSRLALALPSLLEPRLR